MGNQSGRLTGDRLLHMCIYTFTVNKNPLKEVISSISLVLHLLLETDSKFCTAHIRPFHVEV